MKGHFARESITFDGWTCDRCGKIMEECDAEEYQNEERGIQQMSGVFLSYVIMSYDRDETDGQYSMEYDIQDKKVVLFEFLNQRE